MRKFFAGIDKRSFWRGAAMAFGIDLVANGVALIIVNRKRKMIEAELDELEELGDETDEESKEATRDQVKEAVKQATEVLEKEDK